MSAVLWVGVAASCESCPVSGSGSQLESCPVHGSGGQL